MKQQKKFIVFMSLLLVAIIFVGINLLFGTKKLLPPLTDQIGNAQIVKEKQYLMSARSDDENLDSFVRTANDKTNSPIFLDMFEYVAKREKQSQSIFQKHGWNAAKAINITGSHAGYIYTTDRIPGYKGKFPGKNSKRVLVLENRSATIGSQSDFYLEYGEVLDGVDYVPADVWFQFWLYINNYDDPQDKEDQLSGIDRGFKFIYPSKDPYPAQTDLWIFGLGSSSMEPYWDELGPEWNKKTPIARDAYLRLGNFHGYGRYTHAKERDNQWKLGQTDLSEKLLHNRWTLVKLHVDTSRVNGNSYEAWLKPMAGEWKKVVEWIDGKTPGFTWTIPAARVGGHRTFRMPTTVNPNYDWWIYMDDFVMAASENGLPTY